MSPETFAAYLLEGMGETREEPAPMNGRTIALPTLCHRDVINRRYETGQLAWSGDMHEPGGDDGGSWSMDYTLDSYGRLFGRWPEGTDPVALIPVREAA